MGWQWWGQPCTTSTEGARPQSLPGSSWARHQEHGRKLVVRQQGQGQQQPALQQQLLLPLLLLLALEMGQWIKGLAAAAGHKAGSHWHCQAALIPWTRASSFRTTPCSWASLLAGRGTTPRV